MRGREDLSNKPRRVTSSGCLRAFGSQVTSRERKTRAFDAHHPMLHSKMTINRQNKKQTKGLVT